MTAPRGLSQPPTSFIGSQCQGIHHAPLNTYNDNYKPIWKNCTSTNKPPKEKEPICEMLATTIHKSNTTPHHQSGATTRLPDRSPRTTGLLSQSPTVCLAAPGTKPRPGYFACRAPEPHPLQVQPIQRIRLGHRIIRDLRAGPNIVVLLRKEVIQPHLPVRLPCYDFVPIADPTFDGSLPYGLGHRLRVLPTFMT